jgi:hypothetical protein
VTRYLLLVELYRLLSFRALQAGPLTSSLAPDGLDWDFSKRYPDCKSWLEVTLSRYVGGKVQHGMRVTLAEWNAGRQERITKWYKDNAGSGQPVEHMALTCPISVFWYDSDKDTWPFQLGHFWEKIDDGNIWLIGFDIKHVYADDLKLRGVADWLHFWNDKELQVRHKVRAVSVPKAAIHITDSAAKPFGHKVWLRVVHPAYLLIEVQPGEGESTEEWMSRLDKRTTQWYDDLAAEHDMPSSHPLLDMWLDANQHSWPRGLDYFWTNLYDSYQINKIVDFFREEHADDSDMLAVADWLKYWNSIKGVSLKCDVRD